MTLLSDPSQLHLLLKDETRRKIIEMLGEQERVGFKEFRGTLKIGVGTLYYHLDILSDFVAQDKNRKYMLNERGHLLYRAVKEGTMPTALRLDRAYRVGWVRWVFLSPLMDKVANSKRWLPISIAIFLLGAIGSGLARLDPMLLFYAPTAGTFEMSATYFIFWWISAFLLLELLAYVLYRRTGDDVRLLTFIGVAAAPIAAYPYLHIVLFSLIPAPLVVYSLRGALLVLQVWSLVLLTSALSYGKGLRLERAVVLSLIMLYANIALLILLGNLTFAL